MSPSLRFFILIWSCDIVGIVDIVDIVDTVESVDIVDGLPPSGFGKNIGELLLS